jgi:hypothetical protein
MRTAWGTTAAWSAWLMARGTTLTIPALRLPLIAVRRTDGTTLFVATDPSTAAAAAAAATAPWITIGGVAFASVIADGTTHVAAGFETFAPLGRAAGEVTGGRRRVLAGRRGKVRFAVGQAIAKLFPSGGGLLEGVFDGRPRGSGFRGRSLGGATLHHLLRIDFATTRPRHPLLRSPGAFFSHALFPT